MAKNVNIGAARIVMAAIMHTLNNNRKFSNIGTLQALRSPQLAALIAEMNPKNAKDQGRLSLAPGTLTPRVRLNYRKQYKPTVKTTRTVTTGERPQPATGIDVDYALHREYDKRFETIDFFALEAEAEAYLNQVNAGKVNATVGEYKLLGIIGEEIVRTIEGGILQPMNKAALTALIAAVGGNLILGKTAPTNTAVPEIVLYDEKGIAKPDLFDFLGNLRRLHHMEGKPIVIGGNLMATYMDRQKIASAADGIDIQAMYQNLKVEWYFDQDIDTSLGQDEILIFDPGAACLEVILEHEEIIKMKRVANTSFGVASVSVAQTEAATFTMDFDLRVREDDTTAYPGWSVTPSTQFGIFTRPAGYFKDYDGWDTVTGVYRAKLVNATTPVVTP